MQVDFPYAFHQGWKSIKIKQLDENLIKNKSCLFRNSTGSHVIAALYLSVDDLVPAQRARLSESFPTHFTHKRPRAGVHGHVASQVVVRIEHLGGK